MARCTTCALLIKEAWDNYVNRVGGVEKAEAYAHAVTIDEAIAGPIGFVAIYCFGEEPQFVKQLGTEFEFQVVEQHELFGQEHDCEFHLLASGTSTDEAIRKYQRLREAKSMKTNINIANNRGIININSTIEKATQTIQTAPAISDPTRAQLLALFDELKNALTKTPESHSEEAEVVADQVKMLSKELARPKPRESMLNITGSGLIEAAKALVDIVPKVMTVAKQIAEFVANTMG